MITFELVTLERLLFSEEVYEVIVPTPEGTIAILPHHIPVITIVSPGILSLRKTKSDPDGALEHVAISGGIAQITGNKVKILSETAETADEVDELRAQEARNQAKEAMEKATDDISVSDATAALERSLARLKLAELRKRRHRG